MPLECLTHTARGVSLTSWRRQGPGTAVVCVHGAGVSSRELLPFVDALGESYDAWSLDMPGFGRSEKPDDTPTVAGLADAVAAWLETTGLVTAGPDATGPDATGLDTTGLRRPCLLGGSFGCQVVVDLAVRYPASVGALVLAGPTVDPRARTAVRVVGQWLRNSAGESPRMAPLNLADYRDAGMKRVLASFGASLRDRVEDKLPYVDVPVLVVRGGRDRMVSQAWAEEVTRLLPRGRLLVMDGLAHMVPYLDPRGLAREVSAFLREAGV